MKLGLCIPVTHPVGVPLLEKVASLGFEAVRVDLNNGATKASHRKARRQLEESIAVPGLEFDFLLFHGRMRHESGDPWLRGSMLLHVQDTLIKMRDAGILQLQPHEMPLVEIGNEPDLAHERWARDPRELADVFAACFRVVRRGFSPRLRVLTPSVSNLNRRGLDYLREMFATGVIPDEAEVAVHRYPHDGEPMKPHTGFRIREEEVDELLRIIGRRPFHVTEYGHASYQYRGRFTDDADIAEYYEQEVEFWRQQGAASLYLYQINSGRYANEASDDEKRMATYGIRNVSGQWKPIAERVRKIRGMT